MKLRPRTLRGRLALIFALITVIVSASVAAFVLLRYRADLSRQINENLETRYADVRGAVRRAPVPFPSASTTSVIPKAEAFAQVLSLDGEVLEASPRALLDHPLLGPRQIAEARKKRITLERPEPPARRPARDCWPGRNGSVAITSSSSSGRHSTSTSGRSTSWRSRSPSRCRHSR